MNKSLKFILGIALAAATVIAPVHAKPRIKDLTNMAGVRNNQIFGYGLVVGLDGTGDQTTQTAFTAQATASLLKEMGLNLPQGQSFQTKNVAAVMVTAKLPSFAEPGQEIDITVSSIGNAKSLRGGTLLITPLKGVDGEVYALAQGSIIVGGVGAEGASASAKINHLTAGRIPNGAIVENTVQNDFASQGSFQLDLVRTDFGDANRIATLINKSFPEAAATPISGRSIRIKAPYSPSEKIAFFASIQEMPIEANKPLATVVINSRTGTVVLNDRVELEPCAVTHGSLSVKVSNIPLISQPNPFGQGETVVAAVTQIEIAQAGGQVINLAAGSSLNEVINSLAQLGATPLDLISILQAMEQAGSLKAKLEVI